MEEKTMMDAIREARMALKYRRWRNFRAAAVRYGRCAGLCAAIGCGGIDLFKVARYAAERMV